MLPSPAPTTRADAFIKMHNAFRISHLIRRELHLLSISSDMGLGSKPFCVLVDARVFLLSAQEGGLKKRLANVRSAQRNNSCASSPKGGHPSYYQRPRCDSRSASPKKDLRSDTPSLADSKNARVTKPKNFRTPLTCFFWHHTGDCKKPDNQCL